MNPGLFPAGTTPEDYLDGNQKASGSRNPNLAQTLFRGGYIEAFGSGVRRIKEACDAAGVKVEYRQYNDETTVVFHRPGSQVEYVAAGPEASANTDALPDPTAIRENETRKRDAKTRRENETRKRDAKTRRENETRGYAKSAVAKASIIDCLTASASPMGRAEIAERVGLSPSRASVYLRQLVQDGTLVVSGGSRWRVYRLANNSEMTESPAAEPIAPIEGRVDESDLKQ